MTNDNDHESETPAENELLQLPPVDPNASEDMPKIDLRTGGSIKLEKLGPIILNTDGTTRRIENWDQLSPQEQEVSWRRIKKRNEERRKKLEEAANEVKKSNEEGKEL